MSSEIVNGRENKRLLFLTWLRLRHSEISCKKYIESFQRIDDQALMVVGSSLSSATTPQVAVEIIRKLDSRALLDKNDKKVCVFYLSYLSLVLAVTGSEEACMHRPLKHNKYEFEKWLGSFIGLATVQCGAYADDAEEISKKALDVRGVSLFGVRSLSELQSLLSVLDAKMNSKQKRVSTYFSAYLCFCLSEAGEPAIKSVESVVDERKSFEEWCSDRGYAVNTIEAMLHFVSTISAYAAVRGLCPNFRECAPIEQLRILFLIVSRSETYTHFLQESKRRSYVDRYCRYLLDIIPEEQVKELVDRKQPPSNLPVLLMGDAKKVNRCFSQWLRENTNCTGGSVRTFASTLNKCEKIISREFHASLYRLENKFQGTLLRLKITGRSDLAGRKGAFIGPMWLYSEFLSAYQPVSQEQFEADKQRIADLLNKKYKDGIKLEKGEFEAALRTDWLSEYGTDLIYSAEQLVEMIREKTMCNAETGCYYAPGSVMSDAAALRVREYIENARVKGYTVIEYSQMIRSLSDCLRGISVGLLRQYLEFNGVEGYICEEKDLLASNVPENARRKVMGAFVCEALRRIGKPVSRRELKELLPTLSEGSISVSLYRNDFGINVGIINPRGANSKIFHADIIHLTEQEKTTIVNLIHAQLQKKKNVTSATLFSLVKNNLPDLLVRYNFLTRHALYGMLRYKLKDYFTFNTSCVTYHEQMDIPSVYISFCKERERFMLSDLLKIEADLGCSGIPFEQIYSLFARVSYDSFVRRKKLYFDVEKIDEALAACCTEPIIPINQFRDYDKLPPVKNFGWNIFLLEHYLLYHSKNVFLAERNLSKSGCYGLMIKGRRDFSDFDSALLEYLATRKMEYTRDAVFSLLLQEGIIAVRRYEGIDSVIERLKRIKQQATAETHLSCPTCDADRN